jgi:hypothetical protein
MEATVVYRFHIALRDVSPKVWRRVELTAGSSLADPQRVIQLSLGWSDEYQHRFCIRNHYLGASRAGGGLFFGDPETMMLSQFAFRLHERFAYEYNFFDAWLGNSVQIRRRLAQALFHASHSQSRRSAEIGFCRYSSAPRSKAFTAYWSYAVMNTTCERPLACCATSKPLISGI